MSSEEGQKLADQHGVDFYEVSAKEGQGINEAFVQLTKLVIKAQSHQKTRRKSDENEEDVVVLQDIPVVPKKERKCCFK